MAKWHVVYVVPEVCWLIDKPGRSVLWVDSQIIVTWVHYMCACLAGQYDG